MQKRSIDRNYMLLGARIVGDFGATLAIPAVLVALLWKYFDVRWDISPGLLAIGLVLAAIVSAISITRKAKTYGRLYQKLVDSETPREPVSSSNQISKNISKESAESRKELLK